MENFHEDLVFALIFTVKYIFIPLAIAIFGRLLSEMMLRSQPRSQRKKRFK